MMMKKLSKFDLVVITILLLCLVGVGLAAFVSNPANRAPRVAYMYPAFGGKQNVWISDIGNPDSAQQLTFSDIGIFDFDVSPDGRWLAYADRSSEGNTTLYLLDIPNKLVYPLVDCIALNADCTTPIFSPDGKKIAYQRSETLGGRSGLSRIWLIDMTSPTYDTAPLIADTQVVGHSPVWSADNQTIAFYSADISQPGILIFDFFPREGDEVQLRFIPSSYGTMGTLAPNGRELIFPEIINRSDQIFSYLRIANLNEKTFEPFSDPMGPTDDVFAQWSPDGKTIAIARKYTDDRWTQGQQLYLMNVDGGKVQAILFDEAYNTSYFRWNSNGTGLVMQRFPLLNSNGTPNRNARPEVWVYDLETGKGQMILSDAYLPQWA